ncbi:MAG TPA: spore coat U domain-containing protein [Burkholderiales bacterium]|nr:spore coat U domain-containing protein [Burkholderiales bacterium]
MNLKTTTAEVGSRSPKLINLSGPHSGTRHGGARSLALKASLAALSLAAAGLLPSAAYALTTTTTFAVSANVPKNCTLGTVNALAFGAYNPGAGAVNATTNIVVNCTKNTAFNIGLDAGTTVGGSTTTRLMTDGATDTLQYTLWQDSGHATNWGNTVGTDTLAGTGSGMGGGNAITETVYGQIPDNPTNQAAVPAASYTDSITVTVTY